ncbi:MAG: hypothetical protein LCH77_06145 [Actinobacteria bacterium]|uniref:Lipoprotein n=1 Tax=Nostocoides veronense TaxID=330836 RepID=A0ABN2LV89_9MICO|nr:hypothetical protein [Actinomycetota bacterium]
MTRAIPTRFMAASTAAAAIGFGLSAGAGASAGSDASLARPAACPRASGVTVVVDFGATERISCAPGDPTSGLAALKGAGFTVAMVQRFPGAVCRINNRPSPTVEACVVMPPATKYWSYWHAPRGGKWTYSTSGSGSYNPKPGTVEGWAFGAGKPPTVAPPR